MMSHPHTFIRPVESRRLASEADLWVSYSKKAKPLFFFLASSGELYMMTSVRPSENECFLDVKPQETSLKSLQVSILLAILTLWVELVWR